MMKRLWHTGSTLRPRSDEDKAAMVKAIEATVLPWILKGQLKSLIDSEFSLKDAAKAHARMESGQHIGKIVLMV
jgi:NADPH2:quinone reductase